MSAEILRNAARLMRERAKACVSGFEVGDDPGWYNQPKVLAHALRKEYGAGGIYDVDAEHIVSWHPVVALAVADVLGEHAKDHADIFPGCPWVDCPTLSVARAYLGSES